MRSDTFMTVNELDHSQSLNHSKPVAPPAPLRRCHRATQSATAPYPLVLGAALAIMGLSATMSPPTAYAAMINYSGSLTATVPAGPYPPFTDVIVQYDYNVLNPNPISNLNFGTTVPGITFQNQYISPITLLNVGSTGYFETDISPGLAVGESLTVSFTAPAPITSASVSWSYEVDGNLYLTAATPVTFTVVPEPASSVMAAIATCVGLAIGRSRFNRARTPKPKAALTTRSHNGANERVCQQLSIVCARQNGTESIDVRYRRRVEWRQNGGQGPFGWTVNTWVSSLEPTANFGPPALFPIIFRVADYPLGP